MTDNEINSLKFPLWKTKAELEHLRSLIKWVKEQPNSILPLLCVQCSKLNTTWSLQLLLEIKRAGIPILEYTLDDLNGCQLTLAGNLPHRLRIVWLEKLIEYNEN